MTVYGGVVDPAYTRVLMEHGGLKLSDVLALDRVQKGLEVPEEAVRALKRKGLVEGRKPRFRVSSTVGVVGGKEAAPAQGEQRVERAVHGSGDGGGLKEPGLRPNRQSRCAFRPGRLVTIR